VSRVEVREMVNRERERGQQITAGTAGVMHCAEVYRARAPSINARHCVVVGQHTRTNQREGGWIDR